MTVCYRDYRVTADKYGGVMFKSFYFTRHGRVHNIDAVSQTGFDELLAVRKQLFAHTFRPRLAISSDAKRCTDTAYFLTAGDHAKIVKLNELHVFGDIEPMRRQASALLDRIEEVMGEESEVLVVSHDSMSVALAWTVLERRGVTVNWWLPRELRFLDQGEGILVKNKTYWHLHEKAKAKIR